MMHNLLQVAADTLLRRQGPPDRSAIEQFLFVTAGLAPLLTLVIVAMIASLFFRMWKTQQSIEARLAHLSDRVDPMIESAISAAKNVRDLTVAVRDDAVHAAQALSEATGRVRDSVSGIADRIDEFGDLLGRVHDKADGLVDLASAAVSTVKWGARTLNPTPRRKRRPASRAGGNSPNGAPKHLADLDELPEDRPDDGADEGTDEPAAAPATKKKRRSRRSPR